MEKEKVSGLEKVLKSYEKLKKKWWLCNQQECRVDDQSGQNGKEVGGDIEADEGECHQVLSSVTGLYLQKDLPSRDGGRDSPDFSNTLVFHFTFFCLF